MPKKVKVTQKELKSPDEFREAVSRVIDFVSANYTKLLLVLGGVIVVLVAAFVLISILEKRKLEANSKFREAVESYAAGNSEEALGKFLAVKSEYPKSGVSKIALYYAAAINYETGKYDDSIKLLNDFLSSGVEDQMLRDAAHFTLGLSNFNKGNWQQAIDYLSKLDKEGSPYESQAKLHIGMSLEKLGRFGEAEEIYKEILSAQLGAGQGF